MSLYSRIESANLDMDSDSDTDSLITEADFDSDSYESLRLKGSNRPREIRILATNLVPDILLDIFFILRDTYWRDEHSEWRWKEWLTVTKVCRHWRGVALGCPSIWTEVRGTCASEMFIAFLERSASAEINVDLKYDFIPGDTFNAQLALLKDHMWRVRIFKITANSQILQSITGHLLELTQRAKAVTICYERLGSFDYDHVYSKMLNDLPNIIPAVHLDILSLDLVTIPWSSSLYRGLSELDISNCPIYIKDIDRPTVWHFIDILKHCPELRSLRLNGFWPSMITYKTQKVEDHLLIPTRLRHLTLVNMPFLVGIALRRFFALNEYVILRMSFYDYTPRAPVSSSMLNTPSECKSIDIELDDSGFTIRLDPIWDGNAAFTYPEISVRRTKNVQYATAAILAFLDHPSWKSVEAVRILFSFKEYISNATTMDCQSWCSLLNSVPRFTRRLIVNLPPCGSDPDQHSYLNLPDALSTTDESGIEILPHLEELTVYYLDRFARVREGESALLRQMERRKGACKVYFLERDILYDDLIETVHVFPSAS